MLWLYYRSRSEKIWSLAVRISLLMKMRSSPVKLFRREIFYLHIAGLNPVGTATDETEEPT